MDLLANDLSANRQFHDLAKFQDALYHLMALRETAKRFGCQIQCHRGFLNSEPLQGVTFKKAVGSLQEKNQRRAVMAWLTKSGPFWEEGRRHGVDDYLEYCNDVVTDTAVGEAAFRSLHGVECGLISLTHSQWCHSPLKVTWVREAEGVRDRDVEVENWWHTETLEKSLRNHAPLFRSWDDLRKTSENRFANLIFSEECFAPLEGVPFAKSAADRFMALLQILDDYSGSFKGGGTRDMEGDRIYKDFFTGKRAQFSDSSDSEKRKFQRKLTFSHPAYPADSIFCPWHGKVSHLTLRLHFSWPIKAGAQICVVYAGPKITKR